MDENDKKSDKAGHRACRLVTAQRCYLPMASLNADIMPAPAPSSVLDEVKAGGECPICMQERELRRTTCGHLCCESCLRNIVEHLPTGSFATCPMCRQQLLSVDIPDGAAPRDCVAPPATNIIWMGERRDRGQQVKRFILVIAILAGMGTVMWLVIFHQTKCVSDLACFEAV